MSIALSFVLATWLAQSAPDLLGKLAAEDRVLRYELDAAQSSAFYLLLDLPRGKLDLRLKGVELRAYDLTAAEAGRLLGASVRPGWADRLYDCERPPAPVRGEIQPQNGQDPAEVNPLGAEQQADRVPESFTVACNPRLSIRFAPESRRGLRSFLADHLRAPAEPLQQVRLRVRMAEADYDDLYHSLPERAKLIVILAPERR